MNPATGDVLLVHSVCVNSQDEGLLLYPSGGGTGPIQLLARGYGPTTPSWLVYDMETNEVASPVVPDNGSYVRSVTVLGDVSSTVYCLHRATRSTCAPST